MPSFWRGHGCRSAFCGLSGGIHGISNQYAGLGVSLMNQTFDKSRRPTPNSTQAKPGPALTSCWRFHNTR